MVFSPVLVLCHSDITIRRLIYKTIMTVAPRTQIIDVEDWDAAMHALQHLPVTALVAETPPPSQRSHLLNKVTTLWSSGLPIVLLDPGASAFSMFTTAAFAATVKNSDELREAVMGLGRNDIDDTGIAIVVNNACISAGPMQHSYA